LKEKNKGGINFMEIKKGNNMFYIGESEENALGKVEFVNDDQGNIVIEHTTISDELKGQSAGKKLIKRAIDFAREENKKIIPVCPFSKAEFRKNQDYQDVLHRSSEC
jgi:predicted GNAT family acetyltransferase